MKKLMLVAALCAGLAACGDAAEEADDTAAEAPAAAETVAAESSAGTYEFEMDGKLTTAVLNADGTYTDSQDGAVVESGTWRDMEDGMTCFDAEGEDTDEVCFTMSEMDENNTFVATPNDGSEPLTIKKTG
ncbi:MAG TPA: hypothetical protein VEB68_00775 [Croceibacterium sp.]|nr:hypothetical protein [Propylenella sp.]HYD23300.1 hypothetical protein [Croceibacterium sp.]